jgi:2-isopropylmalate synthase
MSDMTPDRIEIYDTSLRDGNQGEGVNLSLADKLEITAVLDQLGVQFTEGGWPGSNPKDSEFFVAAREQSFNQIQISAFGSTHRSDCLPEEDHFLQQLIDAKADVTCIFGKSWLLHVNQALRVSADRNLEMIEGSIRYLKSETGRPVFYDAEHFFDGYLSDAPYALATLEVALAAGASRLILCDTNGGMLPQQIAQAVSGVRAHLPAAHLGIHVHNDGGLAVANTLAAVSAGVCQVQGTINGIGERCGNVDLTSVIANLELKMGRPCLPQGALENLTWVSRRVWELLGFDGPLGQPFVGPSAFAHKGGVHVSAVLRNPETYEHVTPEQVGNARKVLISELAGGSNVRAKLANRYAELEDGHKTKAILEEVQDKEHAGYSFENADGSFDLVVRRHLGRLNYRFEPLFYRIYSPGNENASDQNDVDIAGAIEASVKLRVGDHVELRAAEGSGPVDALNLALRDALAPHFPEVKDLHLTDYTVKVVNSTQETAARVRVLLEHTFEGETFGTVGVNVDVIKASWNALVEAYHYALIRSHEFAVEQRSLGSATSGSESSQS